MDLSETIRQLEDEKQRIELAIAELKQVQNGSSGVNVSRRGRGRKSMGSEERVQVSERMKRHWAKRRELRSRPLCGGAT